jgi:hypothetical protein
VAAGQYQFGSKAILEATITDIQGIYDDPAATQIAIDNAVANLAAAVQLFRSKAIVPIAQENLIAQWTFSEGVGTTVADDSPNNLDGTLMAGHAVIAGRGPIPTWTTDRYGVANRALRFTYGAHIEVPYQPVLSPTSITISAWINIDTVWANNYILSQYWWLGYKFQLQDGNKPFFTVKAGDNIWDRDWNVNGLPDDHSWHQIAVTYTDGAESFYGDGVLIYTWTNVTGAMSNANPQTLSIGQAQPNTLTGVAPGDDPSQWGVGYFKGSLDDIRIYNTALSAVQMQGIYDLEKVPAR